MANEGNEWAKNEFGDASLGDKRLTERLVNIANSVIGSPESSINEACGSWSEAKAAYRFFQNENVKEVNILASHIDKTVERTKAHKRVLVIQDTTYISYSSHKKTSGLGSIAGKGGKGTVMHTSLAVSTEGLVLGSVDKILEKPYKSSNKIEKTHKNLSSLVKSRKNAPKVLDFSKEAFNQMTFFVDMLIVIPLYFSIPFWWNNYYTSLAFKTCNKSITIVAFISHYSRVIDIFG